MFIFIIIFFLVGVVTACVGQVARMSQCLIYKSYLFRFLFFFSFTFFSAQESCQNYIRILVQPSPDRLLVCGTNSFRPMCHLYQINTTTYALETEKSGQAVCPYDPQHNSTAVFVGKCSIRLVCFCLHLGRCQLREVMLSNVQRQTYVVIVCVCRGYGLDAGAPAWQNLIKMK